MNNDFDKKIQNVNQELTDLKTATKYTSVRSASYTPSTQVRTGTYRINYSSGGEPIISKVYISSGTPSWLRTLLVRALPRTPSDNSQIVDINTTIPDGGGQNPITYDASITILYNRQVTGIERIG